MPDDPRVQLPFSGSLDRESGVMVVKPNTFQDIRNVVSHEGRVEVRPGFGSSLALLDGDGNQVSHVVQGHALRTDRVGIVVSYQSATQKVWVHQVDQTGRTAVLIGEWVHDRGGWGASAPRVFMAESYGKMFLAHDTQLVTKRAKTVYYDPVGAGGLADLTADFSGAFEPTLSPATDADTKIAWNDFRIAFAGLSQDVAAGESALAAQTVPADTWALYALSIDDTQVVTITPAAGNGSGYATEALAIADMGAVPSGSFEMGYFTVKTAAGQPWIAGTDALAGGATGNPASETNYYQGSTSAADAPVRFRGVVHHIVYLIGWGYGTEEQDGSAYIRNSMPGDPLTFDPSGYSPVGNLRDPILRCAPAGAVLMLQKQADSYALIGSSQQDFGVVYVDAYGILASGLAATFGSQLVSWSAEGPRLYDGSGPSADISIPLNLGGLEPTSLVAAGSSDYAFAHYLPDLRVVLFVFGQRAYALDVRTTPWGWSYWPLGFTPYCAFTLYAGSDVATAPTGWAEYTGADVAGTHATIHVTNHGQDGDETLEVWARTDPDGVWSQVASTLVTGAATQDVAVDSLVVATAYDVALRYRRGIYYGNGYDSTDPSTWPSASQGTFTTTIDAPTPVSATWERVDATHEQITVVCTPASGEEAQDIKVSRNGAYIGTIAGPQSGNASYVDTAPTGEGYNVYTFQTAGASTDSIPSDSITCWGGPPTVPVAAWVQGMGAKYEVKLQTYDSAISTRVYDDYSDGLGNPRFTMPPPTGQEASPAIAGVPTSPGVQIAVTMRQVQTVAGVDDYSPLSATYYCTLETY